MREGKQKTSLESRAETMLVEMMDRAPKIRREVKHIDILDCLYESDRRENSETVVLNYVGGANDGLEIEIGQNINVYDTSHPDVVYHRGANSLREEIRLAVNEYGEPDLVRFFYIDEKRSRPLINNDAFNEQLEIDPNKPDYSDIDNLNMPFFEDPGNERFKATVSFSRISQYISDSALMEKAEEERELAQRLILSGAHFSKIHRPLNSFQGLHSLVEGLDSAQEVGRVLYDETLRLMGDSVDRGNLRVEYLVNAKRIAEQFELPGVSADDVANFQGRLDAFYDANPDENLWREKISEILRDEEDSYDD